MRFTSTIGQRTLRGYFVPIVLACVLAGCQKSIIRDDDAPLIVEQAATPLPRQFEVVPSPETGAAGLGAAFGEPPVGHLQKLYYVPAGKGAVYKAMLGTVFPGTPLIESYPSFLQNPTKNERDATSTGGSDLLIIRDLEARLGLIEDFLATVETSVPQVYVEATIVELVRSDEYQMGATTSLAEQDANVKTLFDSLTSTFNSRALLDSRVAGNVGGFQGGIFNLGTVHDELLVNMVLELLARDEKTDIKSTPKLLVMSGCSASIITGQETPVQKVRIVNNTTTFDTEFKETGIRLEITPTVVSADMIRMLVRPEVSVVTGFTDPAISGGVANPIISTRRAETSVVVQSGDTLVIGGLDSTQEVEVESRVPVLGSIPLLRYFFSQRQREKLKTNLFFFITVKIGRAGDFRVLNPPKE